MTTIEELLLLSVKKRASDLHLMPGKKPLMRIDGVIAEVEGTNVLTAEDSKSLIYNVMSTAEQEKFEKNLIHEMVVSIPQGGNFRASILHQLHGVAGVFRVVPEKVPTFEEMGLPVSLKSLLTLTQGLILVTGATGSGKTTTLAAMIEHINSMKACHIITIEDPIEFVYKSKKSVFNQLQVGRDTPNFPTALRSSLRQDPNVILLGELRDLETMRLALTAAETGHLVLATLHASSAPLAINRFVDVFPAEEKDMVRNLLAETIQAITCQTLVKKTSGGRVAAFEIMFATAAVRHFIRKDMASHIESTMQTSAEKGMCTLERYLQELVAKGLVSALVADSVLANRGAFKDSEEGLKK